MHYSASLTSLVRSAAFAFLSVSTMAASFAHADTLTFFNTGIAADGSTLAAGTTDSHYNLIYNPDGISETSTATTPNAAWANPVNAGWISTGASGNTDMSSGVYVYETTIDLTGYDPTTTVLSGLIAADDSVYIYLNEGGSALFSSTGYSSPTNFSINSGFVSGINQVDFVVVNNYGPSGLLVENGSLTASAVTPEPSSLLLLGTGMIGSMGVLVRKCRLAPTSKHA